MTPASNRFSILAKSLWVGFLAVLVATLTIMKTRSVAVGDTLVTNANQHHRSMNRLLAAIPIDAEERIPVNDTTVLQAEKFLRQTFNARRLINCSSIPPYVRAGGIQIAKKSIDVSGKALYSLEIVFEQKTVLANISILPGDNDSQGSPQFKLISSVPGPCEIAAQDQLAVSNYGEVGSFT